jgi:hypothetical protein
VVLSSRRRERGGEWTARRTGRRSRSLSRTGYRYAIGSCGWDDLERSLAIAWFKLNAGRIGELKGWAGGGTVAEGPFSGTLYSESFARLGRDTTSFKFWLAVAYTRIWFYDANSARLGAFEGTAVGVLGFGQGPGKWG